MECGRTCLECKVEYFPPDLRQDMLTLQIMTIMDNLWKELGLDLRYTLYVT